MAASAPPFTFDAGVIGLFPELPNRRRGARQESALVRLTGFGMPHVPIDIEDFPGREIVDSHTAFTVMPTSTLPRIAFE